MAGKRISEMDVVTTFAGTELIPIIQDGVNKVITISDLLSNLSNGGTEIVQTLPAQGIVNKIYLVANESSRANDVYDEYIWLTGQGWEFLGNKQITVDLTNYVTLETYNALADRVTALETHKPDGMINLNQNERPTSLQVSKLKLLPAGNFELPTGSKPVLVKNITEENITAEVTLKDSEGQYISTVIYPGWNPELIVGIKGVPANSLQVGN